MDLKVDNYYYNMACVETFATSLEFLSFSAHSYNSETFYQNTIPSTTFEPGVVIVSLIVSSGVDIWLYSVITKFGFFSVEVIFWMKYNGKRQSVHNYSLLLNTSTSYWRYRIKIPLNVLLNKFYWHTFLEKTKLFVIFMLFY